MPYSPSFPVRVPCSFCSCLAIKKFHMSCIEIALGALNLPPRVDFLLKHRFVQMPLRNLQQSVACGRPPEHRGEVVVVLYARLQRHWLLWSRNPMQDRVHLFQKMLII